MVKVIDVSHLMPAHVKFIDDTGNETTTFVYIDYKNRMTYSVTSDNPNPQSAIFEFLKLKPSKVPPIPSHENFDYKFGDING